MASNCAGQLAEYGTTLTCHVGRSGWGNIDLRKGGVGGRSRSGSAGDSCGEGVRRGGNG